MRATQKTILPLLVLFAVGCGASEPPKNATRAIEVDDQQLGVVEKALKEAKVEGNILTVTPFNGEYHVMLTPKAAEEKGKDAGAAGGENSMQPMTAPIPYIIGKDGKARRGP